jgi:hypothetical protein
MRRLLIGLGILVITYFIKELGWINKSHYCLSMHALSIFGIVFVSILFLKKIHIKFA